MKAATQSEKNTTLNAADWTSIYRIVMSPVLLIVALLDLKPAFIILLGLSLASDMLDGIIARAMKRCTVRGARLDSIGDALTFVVAAIGIFLFEKTFFLDNSHIILWAIVPYAAQIVFAVIRFGKPTSYHTYLAKTAALFQGCFILLLLFWEPVYWLLYTTVAITVVEVVEEFILLFIVGNNATDVKGLYWVLRQKRHSRKRRNTRMS